MNTNLTILSDLEKRIVINSGVRHFQQIISNISKTIFISELPAHEFLSDISNSIGLDIIGASLIVSTVISTEPNSIYLDMLPVEISILLELMVSSPFSIYFDMSTLELIVIAYLSVSVNNIYLDMDIPVLTKFGIVTIGEIGHVKIGTFTGKTIQEIMYQEIG